MSEASTLKAELREGKGKGVARKLRAAGRLPAVVYGGDDAPMHISLDAHDAEYLFRNISVDNTIVGIEVEGQKDSVDTLVREIQTHPWKATLLHVDFLRIQKGVMVEMNVPLHLVGTPVGVKVDSGTLEQIIHDLPIRCIPSKIPESIEVDVSALEVNDVMHIADISVGEGVEITIASDRTICSVSPARAEEAAAATEEGEDAGAGADGAPDAPSAEGDEG